MAVKEAKLKTVGAFTKGLEKSIDFSLWKSIEAFMNGETALVMEIPVENEYVFLCLTDEEKNKELHYMIEQNSFMCVYIDDREGFDEAWDNDEYEPNGCIYLKPENVELLESEG